MGDYIGSPQIRAYNADCLVGMSRVGTGTVDLILTDLPYGTTACPWDTVIPFAPLWEQYRRILKPKGALVLMATQPFATDLINSARKLFRYDLIWEKTGPEVPGMMGFALTLPCLAFPWISGTGGALLCGCVWVHSGRAMPFFAI